MSCVRVLPGPRRVGSVSNAIKASAERCCGQRCKPPQNTNRTAVLDRRRSWRCPHPPRRVRRPVRSRVAAATSKSVVNTDAPSNSDTRCTRASPASGDGALGTYLGTVDHSEAVGSPLEGIAWRAPRRSRSAPRIKHAESKNRDAQTQPRTAAVVICARTRTSDACATQPRPPPKMKPGPPRHQPLSATTAPTRITP